MRAYRHSAIVFPVKKRLVLGQARQPSDGNQAVRGAEPYAKADLAKGQDAERFHHDCPLPQAVACRTASVPNGQCPPVDSVPMALEQADNEAVN
jgi:hypothetical protein